MKRNVEVFGTLLCGLMMTGASMAPVASADSGGLRSPQVEANDVELDALLTREASRVMQRLEPVDGQRIGGPVRASINVGTGLITVYFTRDFLPADPEGGFEDQLDNFRHALIHASAPFVDATGMEYLYGGRHLYFYFPKLQREEEAASRGRRSTSQATSALISAGHGYYRRLVADSWVMQRDEHNGVLEDLITPAYAAELQQLMESRGESTVYRARSTSDALHEPSGQEWWKVAGRYNLEAQYPENPEIWNSLGSGGADDRHYKEDIRSRPLVANHHGAGVAIHLHTNAADPAATGVRVIYQSGREQDRVLGSRVLCYMSELIHAVEGYEGFVVSPQPHADNKGENRLALMPSVIVEAAFHTNPSDALALQDPNFRAAAMKGVEKGVRLFRKEAPCQPFEAGAIEDVDVEDGGRVTTFAPFKGYPQFPLTLRARALQCPPGWRCTGGTRLIDESTEEPIPITASCRNQTGRDGQITWAITLTDSDGVVAGERTFNAMCRARPGTASAHPHRPSASAE